MVFIDCWSKETIENCKQLMSATALFDPHPHLGKIRLALLSVGSLPPLTVYLQTGPCWHSCEGGTPQPCVSNSHDFHWQNVSSEMFLPNCGPRHFCCIITAIGDCCSVYTNTTYMEDPHSEIYNSDSHIPLRTAFLFAVFLVMFWAACLYFIRQVMFSDQRKLPQLQGDVKTVNTRDSQPLNGNEHNHKKPVILLYIKEPNGKTFNDNVKNLKNFLTHTVGLMVVDIHEEEETIITFGPDWFKRHDAQLVLVDSETCGLGSSGQVLGPAEVNVRYILDWVSRCQKHSKLFVVSFQEHKKNALLFRYGVTRSYVFPIQNRRLAEDLTNQ